MPLRRPFLLVSVVLAAAVCAPSASARPPRGYTVVHSGLLASPSGTQTRASVACPAGTVPFGGGVETPLNEPLTINSSFPSSGGWNADVDNTTGRASTFEVSVTCGKQPKHYSVVQSVATALAGG